MSYFKRWHKRFSGTLIMLLSAQGLVAEANQEGLDFFEKKIRPLFLNECSKCHGPEKQKAGLRLDKPEFIARGGDNGEIYTPHQVDHSLLIKVVQREIPELEMPPKKHLSESQIQNLRQWISLGAPLPEFKALAQHKEDKLSGDLETVKKHWSFQSLQASPSQVTKAQQVYNPIDRFVHQKLKENQLEMSKPAEAIVLLRRLYLSVIGLPPSEAQIQKFLSKPIQEAYKETVEELLHSKHYGEKWGKHWLNLVRYAESTGKDENHSLPYAYQYRDYVIQAFNDDLPFDEFIKQQLASDLMPAPKTQAEKAKVIPATAFNVFGPKNIAERDLDQLCMDTVDEQLDNVSLTFLGLSMSCARCHDHKFDPISTKEYYALAGIFKSTQTLDAWTPTAIKQHYKTSLISEKDQAHNAPFHEKIRPLREEYKKENRKRYDKKKKDAKLKEIKDQIKALEAQMVPEAFSYAVKDFPQTSKDHPDLTLQDCRVHVRGSYQNQKGEPIPRSAPKIFDHLYTTSQVPQNQSGRLQLAEWIAHPKNPLTARVIANRIWTWYFGRGLVSTTSNFGTTGEKPSHPALLDYLANYLIQNKWSIKQLHRHILASATFQQAYRSDAKSESVDSDKKWLWSFPQQRLDAEIIRDRIMAVSGDLNPNPTPTTINALGWKLPNVAFDHNKERSVYLSVVRNRIHPMFRIFNFTTASMPIPQRKNTSLSTQPLYMNNSYFILKQAEKTASNILKFPEGERLKKAFMMVYSRPSTEKETAVLQKHLQAFKQNHPSDHKCWTLMVQGLFQTHEFLTVN